MFFAVFVHKYTYIWLYLELVSNFEQNRVSGFPKYKLWFFSKLSRIEKVRNFFRPILVKKTFHLMQNTTLGRVTRLVLIFFASILVQTAIFKKRMKFRNAWNSVTNSIFSFLFDAVRFPKKITWYSKSLWKTEQLLYRTFISMLLRFVRKC